MTTDLTRRSLLRSLFIAAQAVILTPKLLMPVKAAPLSDEWRRSVARVAYEASRLPGGDWIIERRLSSRSRPHIFSVSYFKPAELGLDHPLRRAIEHVPVIPDAAYHLGMVQTETWEAVCDRTGKSAERA